MLEIKTVEDLYVAVCTTLPQAKFGLAFNESSVACLTRADGMMENCVTRPSAMPGRWAAAILSS